MARRAPRRYVVRNSIFAVRLRGASEWDTVTVAYAEADHSQARRYWNGRGYETRVTFEDVITTYKSVDAVPLDEARACELREREGSWGKPYERAMLP